MTSLESNPYQGKCDCGYATVEFHEQYSAGIRAPGPFNEQFMELTGLQIITRNVFCLSCGALHRRTFAGTDTKLRSVLFAVVMFVISVTAIVFTLSNSIQIVVVISVLLVALIVGIRKISVYNSEKTLTEHAERFFR